MRRYKLIAGVVGATLLGTAALTGPQANAETLNLISASSHPTGLPWVGAIKDFVVPEINKRLAAAGSDVEINWTELYGVGHFKPTESLESVEGGLAHLAWVGTLWEPAKMPLHTVTLNAPFATQNVFDQLDTMNEMHDNIPALRDAWTKYNQVYLGAQATASYEIVTKFPLEKFSDLQGKKIMSPGSLGQWIKGTGAVAVDGSLLEAFNMLQTGVVDGVILPITNAFAFKLHETAKYVTLVHFGSQTTGALSMNKEVFDALPPDAQKIVKEVGREFSRVHGETIAKRSAGAVASMTEAGAIVTELPQAEKQKWLDSLPPLGANWIKTNAERGPAQEIMTAYMDGLRKRGNKPLRDWDK